MVIKTTDFSDRLISINFRRVMNDMKYTGPKVMHGIIRSCEVKR